MAIDGNAVYTPSELIERIENFLKTYMSFPDPRVALPIALWIIGTHMFESFDSFAYICITAATKQAGKTRLAELMYKLCYRPLFTTGMTPAALFEKLPLVKFDEDSGVMKMVNEDAKSPTMFIDEAEELSKGSAGTLRSFLNSGYRKGQVLSRADNRNYKTYCPKVFVLIGDLFDTLRDRSIVITLRRGEPAARFIHSAVDELAADLKPAIQEAVETHRKAIVKLFHTNTGLSWIPDRDEEIWLPLFSIAGEMCPERFNELVATSVDLCAEKTQEAKRHVDLARDEDAAMNDRYSRLILCDMLDCLERAGRNMTSVELLDALKAIPTSPWRKFRGTGLTTPNNIADMVSRFGVRPRGVRGIPGYKRTDAPPKGYRLDLVKAAIESHNVKRPE